MIKLRWINIITEVSLLSSHEALNTEVHLDASVHIMIHVGERYNSRLAYDILYLEIDHSILKKCYCSGSYWDAMEAIPITAPYLEVKRLIYLWIVIMKEIRHLYDQEMVS